MQLLKMTLGFVFGLLLISCGQSDPIYIGAVLPLKGPAKFVGEEVRDGMQLAVDEVNQKGGINGRPLVMLYSEVASQDQDGIKAAYDSLLEKDPLLIISATSSVSLMVKNHTEKANMPLFALVATAPDLTINTQRVYRYWPTAESEVPQLAGVFPSTPRTLGIIYLDDGYGQAVYGNMVSRYPAATTELVGIPFDIAFKDFEKIAQQVKEMEAVVAVGFDSHLRKIFKALKQIDYKGTVVSTTTATLPSVTGITESDGVYVASPAIYNNNFLFIEKFRKEYNSRYNKPFNHYAANGYDLIGLIAGLLHDQEISVASLQQQIDRGFIYSGVFGNINLDANSFDIDFPLYPAKIEDGRIVFL